MALSFKRPPARAVGRLLTLVVISLLAAFLRMLGPMPPAGSATMLLGFLLLAAFVAGDLARDLRLPRITGYLAIGMLLGPHLLGLLPVETVDAFGLINAVALSIIALQAGGELRIGQLRDRLSSIGTIAAFQIVITMAGVTLLIFLAHPLFPFLQGQGARTVTAVALMFALIAVAKSPATTIAVITELRARGPLTDIVLGVTVFKDVLILFLIAILIPTADVLVQPGTDFDFGQLGNITLAIVLSVASGALIGGLIVLYLEKVKAQPILFVLGVAFLVVELSHFLGLESETFILMSMVAGFVVQNLSAHGGSFLDALEANSLPIYALFFAVAGAALDMAILPHVWQAGMLIIVTRMILIYVSTYLGARAARESAVIRHYAWMGFLAKAGVTLGLAQIVAHRFPSFGPQVAAIVVAMIAVNQLMGPPLFRLALLRAGESKGQQASALGSGRHERDAMRA